MRWTPDGNNEDIEDRRDEGGGGSNFGGGGGGGFGFGGLGIGGTAIVLLLSLVFRTNLFQFFGGGGSVGPVAPMRTSSPMNPQRSAAEEKEKQFVGFVLKNTQDTWAKLLPPVGVQYRHAKLVLFRDVTRSGCGTAESATGPFYCPADEKVYIDLAFYDELRTKFGAPGEFAQAYVLAHEIGHHVQKLLGIEAKVRRLQQQNPSEENPLSVRMELQADCFAGIWAKSTEEQNLLDANDVPAAMQAAASVGDDRLQKMAGRSVRPESFTHGSSAQRQQWFQRGFQSGQISACNTFRQQ